MNCKHLYVPLILLVLFFSFQEHAVVAGGQPVDADPIKKIPKQRIGTSIKQLHVTVDITDDMWRSRRRLTMNDIQSLLQYFSTLEITRVYWVLRPELQNIKYALSPFDPFKAFYLVVEAAHDLGLEMYATFKPFETAPRGNVVPHFISLPPGIPSLHTITGYNFNAVSFLRQHPEFRIKRRSCSNWQQKSVNTIKLVSDNPAPCLLQAQDIEVWISSLNGKFIRYEGDFILSNTLGRRNGKDVRILTLQELNIEAGYRYILLNNANKRQLGIFANRSSKLVELYDPENELIPNTVDQGAISRTDIDSKVQRMWLYATGKWEVPEQYRVNETYGNSLVNSSFFFEISSADKKRYFAGSSGRQGGYVTVAKGKPAFLNTLQPLYPEVRNYWLQQIENIIDAEVDGIDIRVSNHSSAASEPLEYGFGSEVVDAYEKKYQVNILKQPFSIKKWKAIQGAAYTDFLEKVRVVTGKNNVKLQVHINALMGVDINSWYKNNVPGNIEYQWSNWLELNLTDGIMLKYLPWVWGSAKGSGEEFAENVINVAKKLNKNVSWEWRLDCWWLIPSRNHSKKISQSDIDRLLERGAWGWMHPSIDAINIYEGFDFTYMDSKKFFPSHSFEGILKSMMLMKPE